jgi:hypothetical protein
MTDEDRAQYWKGAFERMAARNIVMGKALTPFADLGVGSGPDDQQDNYRIEYRAIRAARAALETER